MLSIWTVRAALEGAVAEKEGAFVSCWAPGLLFLSNERGAEKARERKTKISLHPFSLALSAFSLLISPFFFFWFAFLEFFFCR